jgi:hypothetical protein
MRALTRHRSLRHDYVTVDYRQKLRGQLFGNHLLPLLHLRVEIPLGDRIRVAVFAADPSSRRSLQAVLAAGHVARVFDCRPAK